jgi:glutathione S-transferase
MQLYFSPLACSLATRIALYEAGAEARYTRVDTRTKRTEDGDDFFAVTPMGQVPALRTDDGMLLTENTAVLQFIAERFPAAGLMPAEAPARARMRQWLGFIGTELHKALFVPLLDPGAAPEVKAYARAKAGLRLGLLQDHLHAREHLLESFSIADAYLVTVLNWAAYSGIDLAPWPALPAYQKRVLERPSVTRALGEEFALWKAEQARTAAR